MNYFTRIKWKRWSFILLIAFNILTLVAAWFALNHNKGATHLKDGPRDLLVEKLQLNPEQKAQYFEMVEQHRADMRRLEKQIREAKKAYFESLEIELTTSESAARLEKIGKLQMDIERVTLTHFLDFKQLLNADQKTHFESIYNEALEMMIGGHKGPHPPRRPR